MAYTNHIHLFPAIVALLLAPMLVLATSSSSPAAAGGCSDEVVGFSACLPYISSPPNNISSSPSTQCCDVFSSAFETGVADCLCYLVRRPLLLGFPLNSTRLLSLSSLCPLRNAGSMANGSIADLCSGTSTLPPLQGIIGPGISEPHDSGPDNSFPPLMSSQPDSDGTPPATPSSSTTIPSSSTTIPSSSLTPAIISSAAKWINTGGNWFPIGMTVFLVPIATSLYFNTHH